MLRLRRRAVSSVSFCIEVNASIAVRKDQKMDTGILGSDSSVMATCLLPEPQCGRRCGTNYSTASSAEREDAAELDRRRLRQEVVCVESSQHVRECGRCCRRRFRKCGPAAARRPYFGKWHKTHALTMRTACNQNGPTRSPQATNLLTLFCCLKVRQLKTAKTLRCSGHGKLNLL